MFCRVRREAVFLRKARTESAQRHPVSKNFGANAGNVTGIVCHVTVTHPFQGYAHVQVFDSNGKELSLYLGVGARHSLSRDF